MRQAMRYAGTITSGIAIVLLVYVVAYSYAVASSVPVDTVEAPGLEAVNTEAYLQAAPPPSTSPYDGIGSPTIVVNHIYPLGGLNGILHEATVWTTEPGGLDACNLERLDFHAFYVSAPTGGADASTTNVTYVSDTYGQSPASMTPGGRDCATRASPGKTWRFTVCIEYDGRLDEPKPKGGATVFDEWDACISGKGAANELDSSTAPGMQEAWSPLSPLGPRPFSQS